MASKPSPEIDDELFDEVYGKAYTGPPRLVNNSVPERARADKRPMSNDPSDDDDEPRDPNAVPTDFTSREAKVWEAKAKATERNWKKRKEEEMICKICGEAGHFTQGCPSTLGANRKSADFFERVPARDARVRSLFSEKVIHQIEKDVGCKIKMDDKFLFVSGKDRLILSKGVDAVHKVIQEGDVDKGKDSSSSVRSRSRSPNEPAVSQQRRSESQRSHSGQRNVTQFQRKNIRQEKVIEDHLREDLQTISRGSPQARAYNNEGAKRRPMHSKSPQKATITRDRYSSYHGQGRNGDMQISSSQDGEKQGVDTHSGRRFSSYPQTLEELEMKFKKEAMELGRVHDKEEDEEIYRHRESIRDIRENYMKKLAIMRDMHAKQWEKFLQLDIQRQQQAYHNAYSLPGYFDDRSSGNPEYAGAGIPMDSHNMYQFGGETYPISGHREAYGELQRPRNGDFGKTYGQF